MSKELASSSTHHMVQRVINIPEAKRMGKDDPLGRPLENQVVLPPESCAPIGDNGRVLGGREERSRLID